MPFLPPSHEVHVWSVDVEQARAMSLGGRYLDLCDPSERKRHSAFAVPEPAFEYVVGRALLRTTLGAYLDLLPQDVELVVEELGRPVLAPPHHEVRFSLAHSRGVVVCAVALGASVGVDVEDVERPIEALELAQRFFCPSEAADLSVLPEEARRRRFFQLWTLKEACLKALGTGLREGLDRFCFDFSRGDTWPQLVSPDPRWQLGQLSVPPRHLVAVALREETPANGRQLVVRTILPLVEDMACAPIIASVQTR